jgi:DNA polymerase III delta prime subunit
MYIEKLKEIDIFELFPSLENTKKILLSPNDTNILFNTTQVDYTYVFEQLLEKKYPNNPFKTNQYKENNYNYNEYCYILDCKEWNILEFTEFIVEYSKLNSINMKPNLFILSNIDILDKNSQNVLGTLIETTYTKSRFWFFCNHIAKIPNKIIHRVLTIIIGKNIYKNFKQNLLKIVNKPIFEIIIDKIIQKSNGDYGAALLYLDMLTIDSSILNRELFTQERLEIKKFIEDEEYTTQNYQGLREVCFRLLEKTELIDIFYNFIHFFQKFLTRNQFTLVLSRCAEYLSKDKIMNKQVWLLESWLLDTILIYRGYNVNSTTNFLEV